MNIRRLGYALGAEVSGIDFSQPVAETTIDEIRKAWLDYVMLCFRDAELDPPAMAAFCSRFGDLDDHRNNPTGRTADVPVVQVFANIVNDRRPEYTAPSDNWHTDRPFTERPTMATFLNAKALPDVGGETLFANMYAAYETLSPALQRMLDPLEGVYDISRAVSYAKLTPEVQQEYARNNPPIAQPLARVHPETGRKALFLDSHLLRNIAGMTEDESRPILDYLLEHATRYEFTYRHRWKINDMLMWDNRCAMHRLVPDFDPRQARRMQRISVMSTPVSPRA